MWLSFRFSLSYRDVEELLAERGIIGIVKLLVKCDEDRGHQDNEVEEYCFRWVPTLPSAGPFPRSRPGIGAHVPCGIVRSSALAARTEVLTDRPAVGQNRLGPIGGCRLPSAGRSCGG